MPANFAKAVTRPKGNAIMFEIIGWGLIVSLVVLFARLIHSMLTTRRTLLRMLGYVICSAISIPFIVALFSPLFSPRQREVNVYTEPTKIINDLRNLCSAARLFRQAHGRPPLPGEEASLDLYMDRPLTAVKSPRYAKVTLTGELSGDMGASRQYVGVELIPEKNGISEIQKKLATRATDTGLLGEALSGDKKASPYKSGLNVYMEILLD
jgi:hypothetical protein